MKLVKLKKINLLYSNIDENEASAWRESVTYNKGDKVIVTSETPHKVYESLINSNTGNYPPDTCWYSLEESYPEWNKKSSYDAGDRVKVSYQQDGITPRFKQAFMSLSDNNVGNYPPDSPEHWESLDKWRELEVTNRWKMFDGFIKSKTQETDAIEVVVEFPLCDVFCLFGLYANSIEWFLYNGDYTDDANLVTSGSIDNLQEPVQDWLEYFYSDIQLREDVYVDGIPLYRNGQLKVRINKPGEVKCGMMVIGRSKYLADTMYDVRVSGLDYSKKRIDEQGNAILQQGAFAKVLECDLWLPTERVDIVRKELIKVRATPCVFNFANSSDFQKESLIIYGFYKDFEIVIPSPAYSKCSIQIEGLI